MATPNKESNGAAESLKNKGNQKRKKKKIATTQNHEDMTSSRIFLSVCAFAHAQGWEFMEQKQCAILEQQMYSWKNCTATLKKINLKCAKYLK